MTLKKLGSNNAGLSLVELLVALAVSSMVIIATMVLLTNGISSYKRQTVTAQLQEEADIALTHISDAVLEADVINVDMSDSENGSTEAFYVAKEQAYGYKYDKEKQLLYVITKDASDATIESVLCSNVTKFKIQMLTDSVSVSDTDGDGAQEITGVSEVVQIKVNIEVESGGITRTAARVTGVRNTMVTEDIKLLGFTPEDYPSVQYLKEYGFLVDE